MRIDVERFKRRIKTRRYRVWLGARIAAIGTVLAVAAVPLCIRAEDGSVPVIPQAEQTAAPVTVSQVIMTPSPSPAGYPVNIYDVPLAEDLQLFMIRLCEEHHIDPAVVLGMAQRESQFTADAIGDGGDSYGMFQVQPKWHQDRMDRLGVTDLLDPRQCAAVAVDYLAELLGWYDGDVAKALTAYNQGSFKGVVSDYANAVLDNSENIKKGMVQVFYTDNPLADFERWEAERDHAMERLPVCVDCGHPIQDETAYYIDGEWICTSCMSSYEREVMPE